MAEWMADRGWIVRGRAAARRWATAVLAACVVGAGLAVVPDVVVGGDPVTESADELSLAAEPGESPSTSLDLGSLETDPTATLDPFNVLPQVPEGGSNPLPEATVDAEPVEVTEPLPDEPLPEAPSVPIEPEPQPPAPVNDDPALPVDDAESEPVVFDGPGLDPGIYEIPVDAALPDPGAEGAEVLEVAASGDAELDRVTVAVIDVGAIVDTESDPEAEPEPAPEPDIDEDDDEPAPSAGDDSEVDEADPAAGDDAAPAVEDAPTTDAPAPDPEAPLPEDGPPALDDDTTEADPEAEEPLPEASPLPGDLPEEEGLAAETLAPSATDGVVDAPEDESEENVDPETEGSDDGAVESDEPSAGAEPVEDGEVESPPISEALLAFALSGDQSADVAVAIDISQLSFDSAGDRAERLRLVEFPGCALTDPHNPRCAIGTPVEGAVTDAATLVLETDLGVEGKGSPEELGTLSGGSSIFALMSATGSEAGNYGATPIASNGTWAGGQQAGNFSYSYPIPMPAGIAGPTPQLSLGYSSAAVDSMTTETNNQPGPIGIGWSLSGIGYIERTYQPCAIDGTSQLHPNDQNKNVTEELCWIGNNATIVLNGVASRMIPVNATLPNGGGATEWVLENDPGWKVERFSDGSGGPDVDNRWGEYWVITDLSGTKYTFGQSDAATLNVPVLSNAPGEPCYGDENESASGASRWCSMPWRWNIEKIEDLNGNEVEFWWTKETNRYNKAGLYPTDYDREGLLTSVRYGRNDSVRSDGRLHMAVNLYYGDRCFTSCHVDANWEDTPRDLSARVARARRIHRRSSRLTD